MNCRNKIFIISLMILVLLSVSFASAAQNDTLAIDDGEDVLNSMEEEIQTESFNNENISSSNDNDILSDDEMSYDELQTDIDNEDTVNLHQDVRYGGDGDRPHIDITKTITINGNNHYISGNEGAGIFRFDNAEDGITLTLKNLVLKDAVSDNGGAIHTKKNVNIYIINCTFYNDYVIEDGGAIYFDSTGTLDIKDTSFEKCITKIEDGKRKRNGGAINTHDGTLAIDNCIFKNNVAGFGYGGAIYLQGECSGIRNSVFENNTARSRFGGAVYVETDNENGVEIDNCSFTNNTSIAADRKVGSGGAIYYDGKGLLRLMNSNFTKNEIFGVATWNKQAGEASMTAYDAKGGAVSSLHDIEIGNCIFIKNHAIDRGGAVNTEEGIRWILGPSIFIGNTIGHSNVHLANKGGAIYASKFLNDANGLVFIDNHGWYGGAIYIQNKNEINFESCVFINNSVWNNDGKEACGGAIYLDSSSSKVSLSNNIFFNNHATTDRGIYNCGNYGTVTNNWFGYNDVDFNDAYLLEWHRIGSNDKISDSNPLKIILLANQTEVFHSPVKLTLKFVCRNGKEFSGKLTNWTVDFTSSNAGTFSDLQIGDNEATVIFTPEAGEHVITAKVHGQKVSINLNQMGDFTWLQQQVDTTSEGGVLNLNRDLAYTPGIDMTDGVKITKSIVINGNGHKIDGLNAARIFSINSNNVKINNITFVNGKYSFEDKEGGGAIFIDNGNNIQILNSQFLNNTAPQGGAIHIDADNVVIDGCEFRNNFANGYQFNRGGGAISNGGKNLTVSNSIFLNNKAETYLIPKNISDDRLILTLVGLENYINAIWSSFEINFTNVTYWDGKITTGNNPVYSENVSGQNFTLEIFNSNEQLVKKVTLVTDINGQAVFDFSKLETGNYTYKATHFDDIYYTTIWTEGEFSYIRVPHYPSEVRINMPDVAEFLYGDCNITFDITNRTVVEVFITNEDNITFYDMETDLNYITADLPASDKYYYIFIYNNGNGTIDPSSDYKSFKILKINSTVTVNPVSDADYGKNISVSFTGDGTDYNVTVFNKNNDIVFSDIINGNSIDISDLPAGEYNVTVVNLGNTNKTKSKDSAKFNVNKINNNFKVEVADGVYGKDITVTVTADVDGDYTVSISSRTVTVHVENGEGSEIIADLDAGNYTARVTFENANCNNNATDDNFTVQMAQSHVKIVDLDENITWNQTKTIRFSDFNPLQYNVTICDSGNNIKYTVITSSILFNIPILSPGQYNLTVTNLGNGNVIGSQDSAIFTVVKDNFVEVYVEDVDYGRDLTVIVMADADGDYIVNINGTEIPIKVINGTGSYQGDEYLLNAGNYTSQVIFDNPDYNTIINNTNFTVYPAESNVKIYEIEDMPYGEDIEVKFYDDYPTFFNIKILNMNNETEFNVTFEYSDKRKNMTVIFAGLGVGQYKAFVENIGDENGNVIGSSNSMYFNVVKATPEIVVDAFDVSYPEDVVIFVLSDVGGNYAVKVGNQTQNITLVAGEEIQLVFSNLPVGEYVVNVTYEETENYTFSYNDSVNVTVDNKTKPTLDASYTVNVLDDGFAVNIIVNSDPKINGNLSIKFNGKEYPVEIVNGTAKFTSKKVYANTYNTTIFYAGSDEYKNTSTTVKAIVKTTKVSKVNNFNFYYYNNDMGSDSEKGISIIKVVDKDGKPIKKGLVTITIMNKYKLKVKTDANGIAKFTKAYKPGTYTVTATHNNKITKLGNLVLKSVVNLPKVTKVSKTVKTTTIKITLKGTGPIKGKTVVVNFMKVNYKVKTNNKGVAQFKVTQNMVSKLAVGKTYKIRATYRMDSIAQSIQILK